MPPNMLMLLCSGGLVILMFLTAWTINLGQSTRMQLLLVQQQLSKQHAITSSLTNQLLNAESSWGRSISAAATSSAQFSGMYMGDGKMLCLVRPLGGVPMFLEGADVGITPHLCRGLGWEPDTSNVFRRLIRPGYHVLDVGTNVGYFTIMFTQIVGSSGRVLGIEASPRTHQLAYTSVEVNGYSATTQVINKAVYDTDGQTVQISTSRERILNNRVMPGSASSGSGSTAPVSTITIDTAVSDWTRLDFIKIDVEGAEQLAYRGMRKTLTRFPNIIIIMEVNTARLGLDKARGFYEELQRDFPKLRRLVGSRIQATTVDELYANTKSDDMVVLTKRTDI